MRVQEQARVLVQGQVRGAVEVGGASCLRDEHAKSRRSHLGVRNSCCMLGEMRMKRMKLAGADVVVVAVAH